MLHLPRLASVLLFGLALALAFALPALSDPPAPGRVWFAEIRGSINPATSDFLKKSIQGAEADSATALIVELDTPGGLVSSVREMAQAIDTSKVPVVVYVHPAGASATSAGALLMLASHLAAMAPGTNLGAAHPVGAQGEEIKGPMGEKAAQDTAAFARGLAELRGRPTDLAEAVVLKSRSFTAEEAHKQRLIEIKAETREQLMEALNGRSVRTAAGETKLRTSPAVVKMAEMHLGQKLLHLLANPNIAAILMTLGLLLIYVELSAPGIGVAGVLGGICLLVALMATQLIPIQTGGLVLIGLGMALLIAEIFVTSYGILAVGGILSFILGMIWLVDPAVSDLRVSPQVWGPIALGLGSAVLLAGWALGHSTRLTRTTLTRIGGSGLSGLAGYHGKVESLQDDRMSGKVLIRGELWDFRAEAPLEKGDGVQIVALHGMIAQVRKLT